MDAHDPAEIRALGPGASVDTNDQLSSVLLLGLAVAGAAVAVFLNALVT